MIKDPGAISVNNFKHTEHLNHNLNSSVSQEKHAQVTKSLHSSLFCHRYSFI